MVTHRGIEDHNPLNCQEIREVLDAHVLGALDEATTREVEIHLKNCSSCREHLAATIQALDTLHALPGIEPGGGYADKILTNYVPRRKFMWWILLIGFILLLSGLTLLWSIFRYRQLYPYHHMTRLERGIWSYYSHHQAFPKATAKELADLLLKDKAGGPFISKDSFKTNRNGEIVDAWGNPYVYRYPALRNTSSFDLYSWGKNGIDEKGKGDDIGNWSHRKK